MNNEGMREIILKDSLASGRSGGKVETLKIILQNA